MYTQSSIGTLAANSTASETFLQLITPSDEQRGTVIAIGIYIVAIAVLWNIRGLNKILFPFKIVTVAFHEFGHACMGVLTGAKIESIELDPDEGGKTTMRGGIPMCTLPAGYLGSSLIGAGMIFAGFDTASSKIVSIIISIFLLMTLWWARNWLTRGVTLLFIGLLAAAWFIEGGFILRYFVLFMGVMSCLYSVWDILEDLVFRKVNESDASHFAKLCHCCPAQFWGFVWFIISLAFLVAAVLGGLIVFKSPTNINVPF